MNWTFSTGRQQGSNFTTRTRTYGQDLANSVLDINHDGRHELILWGDLLERDRVLRQQARERGRMRRGMAACFRLDGQRLFGGR